MYFWVKGYVKVGFRGEVEPRIYFKMPDYFWYTAWYIKFLRVQQIIIRVCVWMCNQILVIEGFIAQCTDVLSNCSYAIVEI